MEVRVEVKAERGENPMCDAESLLRTTTGNALSSIWTSESASGRPQVVNVKSAQSGQARSLPINMFSLPRRVPS